MRGRHRASSLDDSLFARKGTKPLSEQVVDTQDALYSLMFKQPELGFFASLRLRLRALGYNLRKAINNNPMRALGYNLRKAINNNPIAANAIISLLTIAVLTGVFIGLSILIPPVGVFAASALAAVASYAGITAGVASLSTTAAAALGATMIGVGSMLLDAVVFAALKGIAMCMTAYRRHKLKAMYADVSELDSSGTPVDSLVRLPLAPAATGSDFAPASITNLATGAVFSVAPTSLFSSGGSDASPVYLKAGDGDTSTFPPPSLDSF
jgi:hypothetical protein